MRRTAPVLVSMLLFAVGCGADSQDALPADDVTSSVVRGGEGWIGDEPDWSGSGAAARSGGSALADADVAGPGGPASVGAASAESGPSPVAPGGPPADEVRPVEPGRAGPLRAGSVDDNADFVGYLEYLERVDGLGFAVREFDPSGRIVVTVQGADGRPVLGEPVRFIPAAAEPQTERGQSRDSQAPELRTDASGQVIFLPTAHGTPAERYTVHVDGDAVDVDAGEDVVVELDRDGGREAGVALDVLFLLDVTGSMGDEIDRLKTTISDVAQRIRGLPAEPDVRFGMTLYRDEGDEFVTATFDLTDDIEAFRTALSEVSADGGGDGPEALDEAFEVALDEPSWRPAGDAVQLVFLVADAPPQVSRQVTPYTETMIRASERGITVHPIAASNSDDAAEYAFRAIAQATGGRFVFLSYGAGGAAVGESSDIGPTDYEELSLDDLVVRLIGEELAALTGTDPPEGQTTTTTVQGQ